MEDNLIELLESLDFPVYRQGSFQEGDKYPDSFFTFWNNETPNHSFYDNKKFGYDWNFNIYIYSNDPEITYSGLNSAISLLEENGWIINGKGFDAISDEPTHTGRGVQIFFLETKEN